MKNGYIEILDLDFEYKLWKNDLQYYSEQIKVMEDWLVVLAREDVDVKQESEYKNWIKNQKEAINKLQKTIINHEHEIAFYAEDYPITQKHSHYTVHETIRKELDKVTFRQKEILTELSSALAYPVRKNDLINL